MATEAVRTKERELVLGGSLSSFMGKLGLPVTGGRTGTVGRLRDQMSRLFTASFVVSATRTTEKELGWQAGTLTLADETQLWWSRLHPADEPFWRSSVTLSERFFTSIVSAPVPVDLRALRALRGSALRLDLYTWLTYRMSYLRRPTTVPWEGLAAQFGTDYKHVRQFKAHFVQQLAAVRLVYPLADIESTQAGLVLRPSPAHVASRRSTSQLSPRR
jgi:hypothetical protein